jgi:hypothetical protein
MAKHFIHLPNGKSFQIRTEPDVDVKGVRDFMATSEAVNLDIVKDLKPAKLILWGDCLKNSFIIVEEE